MHSVRAQKRTRARPTETQKQKPAHPFGRGGTPRRHYREEGGATPRRNVPQCVFFFFRRRRRLPLPPLPVWMEGAGERELSPKKEEEGKEDDDGAFRGTEDS